jgi:hypothetical protein
MKNKRTVIPAMVVLIVLVAGTDLLCQVPRTGQQVPPMPRTWNEGLGSWLGIGVGPFGMVAAFSRDLERSVVTLHGGLYWKSPSFSGGDLGLTIGLPLSRNRLFASVGGGLGCLVGTPGEAVKSKPELSLAADLQMSFRLSSRIAFGIYSDLAVSIHRAMGGLFLCIQYGHWEL